MTTSASVIASAGELSHGGPLFDSRWCQYDDVSKGDWSYCSLATENGAFVPSDRIIHNAVRVTRLYCQCGY